MRRTFSGGELRLYGKTGRSRRRVPLRQRVLDALALYRPASTRRSSSPALRGGYMNLHNFRARQWIPAVKAAGFVKDGKATKRIYDLRALVRDDERGGRGLPLLARPSHGHERGDDRP